MCGRPFGRLACEAHARYRAAEQQTALQPRRLGTVTPNSIEKVVIVGSGPAGLTAAIYAARANLQPLMFEGFSAGGLIPGGQLMFTTEVENYPGFPHGVQGPEMMRAFRQQAERFETRFITEDVVEIELTSRPFRIRSESHAAEAHSIIIATGARANWLG